MQDCSALCFNSSQRTAVACLEQGPKTFLSAVLLQDPIQPRSACLLSTDPGERFFSIEKFPANDAFLASSNRRVVLFLLRPDDQLEPIDTICVFPTNPLLCSALRSNKLFCLEARGVSLVELKDSSQQSAEKQQRPGRPDAFPGQPPPRPVQAIAKSPVKRQAFAVPTPIPRFGGDPADQPPTATTRQVSLPFDVGRVRRLHFAKESNQLLFGGEVLNFLALSPSGSFDLQDKKVPMSFFSVFSAASGYLLLNDSVSNDLLVLDSRLQQVNRYAGVPDLRKIDCENFKYVQQHKDFMLWLAGPAKVVKIHPDLLMEEVKLFDADFLQRFNPYVYLLQAASSDAYCCAVLLEGKGVAVALLKQQKTQVVMLSTLPGERSLP